MKNKLRSLIIFTSIAIAISACTNQATSTSPENDQIKADTSKTEVQANYVCPMGKECGYSDVAGKCGSCGMDLVATK